MNRQLAVLGVVAIGAAAMLVLPACSETKEVTHNTASFVKGGSSEVFATTPDKVEAAVKLAVEDLRLVKTAEATETEDGKTTKTYTFRSTDEDKKVVIAITGLTDKSTRVEVSNGAFGDADGRQIVLGKIRQHVSINGTPTGV